MGVQLEEPIPHFNSSQHLIGCLAHVINLSACAGLDFFAKHLSSQLLLLPIIISSLVVETELDNTCGALLKIDALTKLIKKSSERSRDCTVMASTTCGIMKPLCIHN